MFELIQIGDFHGLGGYIVIRVSITMVCWFFMIAACLIDFWSGITTARALHEPLMSHGFRRTFIKIGEYWRVMLFALLFDILGAFLSFYYLPFATMLCTASVLFIEGRSVIENSRRKKSSAADVVDVSRKIAVATTRDEVRAVISDVIALYEKSRKYGKEDIAQGAKE